MSTNQEKLISIPDQPPVVQPETAPTANEPVIGSDVHAKGLIPQPEQSAQSVESEKNSGIEQKEIEVPEKGDVFVKPGTPERIIVEGIRKEGDGTIVQFSYESRLPTVDEKGTPVLVDVRKEPGKNFYQLPMENFAVLVHENGGYSEYKPIYRERLNQTAEEFGEIWNASQELLVKVLAQGDNEEDSDAVKQEKNRVIGLLQEIGSLEDEWDALGEDDSRAKYAGALVLLKRSKKLVGELPESLVVSNSLLRQVQKEYGAKDDDVVEEGGVRKGKMKKNKRSEAGLEGKEKTKRDVLSKRGRLRQGVTEASGVSRFDARENYPENGSAATEVENGQREGELKFWTDDIRDQQREREALNARILERDLAAQWGEAMKVVDPELEEKFAQKPFRYINGEIEDIWQQYDEWRDQLQRERASVNRLKNLEMFDQWLEKSLDTLTQYSKQYQTMIEIGRKVLEENRGKKPKLSGGQPESKDGFQQAGEQLLSTRRSELADKVSSKKKSKTRGSSAQGAKQPEKVAGDRKERKQKTKWEDVEVGIQAAIQSRIEGAAKSYAENLRKILEGSEYGEEQLSTIVRQAASAFMGELLKKAANKIGITMSPKETNRTILDMEKNIFGRD